MNKARVVAGVAGIVVGIVGLANIVTERRAAEKRQRVLTTLAENFRQYDQQRRTAPAPADGTAVVWEGRTFRPGDRVRIRKWAGTFKPSETGANVEVQASAGHTGVVVGGEKRASTDYLRVDPSEPIQIVRVRWLPQRWNGSLDLPQFEATIHVSHLEVVR